MEDVKRLPPTQDTLRRLYTVSGNQCAFSGCVRPMFNEDGNFVGQVCHIEAAMPGGERFNEKMTNEERRSFGNLMLMCYEHHIETNKVHLYGVEKLRSMKRQHEDIYSNVDEFVRRMESEINDVTLGYKASKVYSLSALYVAVYGEDTRELDDINDDVQAFNEVAVKISLLSPDARKILSISLHRSKYEQRYNGREGEKLLFDPEEVRRVVGLRVDELRSIFDELCRAELIYWDEELYSGKSYYYLYFPGSEVYFWSLIKEFAGKGGLNLIDLVNRMQFSIFD